jgi:hypothetical protein
VVNTALAFAITSLLLAWLAFHSLFGPQAGTAHRTTFAVASIVAAGVVFAVSLGVVLQALRWHRRLVTHLRPGEEIAGSYSAELLAPGSNGRNLAERIGMTLTNQRLLLHRPERNPHPAIEFEHDEIADARELGPAACPGLRRCILHELALADAETLLIRMSAATALDFAGPRQQYLEARPREMRALILETAGPTPSRPAQSLDSMLVDGEPTVCLLELDENYLRVLNERKAPMDDLYYYFHWEHMSVGEPQPMMLGGFPESWQCLRLQFHDTSSLVVCTAAAAIERLRNKALDAGAAPLVSPRAAGTSD